MSANKGFGSEELNFCYHNWLHVRCSGEVIVACLASKCADLYLWSNGEQICTRMCSQFEHLLTQTCWVRWTWQLDISGCELAVECTHTDWKKSISVNKGCKSHGIATHEVCGRYVKLNLYVLAASVWLCSMRGHPSPRSGTLVGQFVAFIWCTAHRHDLYGHIVSVTD